MHREDHETAGISRTDDESGSHEKKQINRTDRRKIPL
jgi:hypothetical protein